MKERRFGHGGFDVGSESRLKGVRVWALQGLLATALQGFRDLGI